MSESLSSPPSTVLTIDTSALMAILLAEPQGPACQDALIATERLLISAGTVTEALIVATRRGHGLAMQELLASLDCEVRPVTEAVARRVALAYGQWGKGMHPAGLDFGDCFAYETARTHGSPLLYVGMDFARTDVVSVL